LRTAQNLYPGQVEDDRIGVAAAEIGVVAEAVERRLVDVDAGRRLTGNDRQKKKCDSLPRL